MLAEIAHQAARRFGSAPALVARDGWAVSFAQLDQLSDEVAAGLAGRGVAEGDVVALLLPSGPEYIVAYLAAAKLGAATTGVNPVYTATERAAVLDVALPRLVLGTAELLGDLPAGVGGGADLVAVPRATGPGDLLDDLRRRAGAGGPPPPPPPSPDRPVAIVFTSGTTGRPRGAVFGDRQLDAIGRMEVPGWDDPEAWGGGAPMVAATQLAHVGFMTKLPVHLRTGCRLHLLERWRAAEVLALVAAERMPGVGGVAPQLALLLADPTFDDHDLSCVRTVVAGGAASPPALVREARERFGAAYSIRYSSTETGGVGTGTAFDADDEEALHTVGRPRPGIQVEIRPPAPAEGEPPVEDRALPRGQVGEVCLRSPATMQGYWRDPEATAAALRGGWLRTGDLGLVDERGCLRLAGRAKEMYVRGGYNVYPVEVEAVLGSHPDVAAVAVVPAPDPVMGEVGVAVVVPHRPGQVPTLDELRRFGRERLASFKLPARVVEVDALPLTAMLKVDRTALRTLVST